MNNVDVDKLNHRGEYVSWQGILLHEGSVAISNFMVYQEKGIWLRIIDHLNPFWGQFKKFIFHMSSDEKWVEIFDFLPPGMTNKWMLEVSPGPGLPYFISISCSVRGSGVGSSSDINIKILSIKFQAAGTYKIISFCRNI